MEEWRDIKGYEELYQVSNLGRVKSMDRSIKRVINGKEVLFQLPSRILFQWKNSKGYYSVVIGSKADRKTYKVHRLVAEAFIPNPSNLPQVNHKDEDKSNNRVDNLEWCTNKYNCNYGTYKSKLSEKFRNRVPCWLVKGVCQYSMDGKFIKEFKSLREAAREVITSPSNISMCCKGVYSSCKGYKWKLKEMNYEQN